MPNLFTRTAQLRWYAARIKETVAEWRKAVKRYADTFASMLSGIASPGDEVHAHRYMASVWFKLQALVKAYKKLNARCA